VRAAAVKSAAGQADYAPQSRYQQESTRRPRNERAGPQPSPNPIAYWDVPLPKTVLCVDDDLQIFEELRDRLQDGEILIHTDDLADAFAIVTEEEPDLVVLELELRDGNGLDLLERVRNEGGPLASVSTLVVTRCGRTPGLYGRAVQLGVVDYLMKPVVYSQLVASVEESLAQKSPQAAGDEGVATGVGSGRLRDLPLPELLDRVYRSGESGVLIVGDARARTGIQIRNGSPAAVTLSRPEALHEAR
jgi:PleD family two-component response regulator